MTQIASSTPLATGPVGTGSGPAAPAARHHFSFSDFLDIVNPLQHLPIVGTLYRKITGDEIDTPEKIIGDTLFGGIPGLISSVADTAFEKVTGKSFEDTALAMFDRSGGAKLAPIEVSQQPFALAAIAPSLDLQTDTGLAPTETEITAALNRAQIHTTFAAYSRAGGLAQPKSADGIVAAL